MLFFVSKIPLSMIQQNSDKMAVNWVKCPQHYILAIEVLSLSHIVKWVSVWFGWDNWVITSDWQYFFENETPLWYIM